MELPGLHVIVIWPDEKTIGAVRRRLDDAGLYGTRAVLLHGDPLDYPLAPYMARLIMAEDRMDPKISGRMLNALRPYGGTAVLPATKNGIEAAVKASGIKGLEVTESGGMTRITRVGPLPGSAPWSHQYADVSNSVVGADSLVRAPLGLLWYGGPSNDKILPRHGHGPSPLVAGGRLVIEGPDMLRAVDVYTGTVLWEKDLPGIGRYHDNTSHQAGAGGIGSNYVVMDDAVYVIYKRTCMQLDPDTGKTVRELTHPSGGSPSHWGFVGCDGDLLIAGISPIGIGSKSGKTRTSKAPAKPRIKNAVEVIKRNAEWQYLAGGKHPPAGWAKPGFNTSGWKKGRAGFGYGDGDDKTVLDMRGKYASVYIRALFDAKAVAKAAQMALCVNYDDGFVAYLNGMEIARAGVRGSGAKVTKVSSHEAGGFEQFDVKDFRKHLRPGSNVLALEGHNTSKSSSDFSLDPYLVVSGVGAVAPPKPKPAPAPKPDSGLLKVAGVSADVPYATGSRRLVVFDRNIAKQLWSREAAFNFRHNTIIAGKGRIYCIDALSPGQIDSLKRRGHEHAGGFVLYALDAKTGRIAWKTDRDVFGTWLGYSRKHDVLLQGGSKFRDREWDEVGKGIVAYRGSDGKVLWKDLELGYSGPPMIRSGEIITNGNGGFGLELLTGKKTGFQWRRHYGCNTAIASENIITFRSGAAGYYDLATRSGTGNMGGFKSSCTSNLIPADGVLNAPDYTRTCTCAYQNQSSLAMIHMPDAEMWTFGGVPALWATGINFGAPGNRRGPGGTLWLDFPSVGGEADATGIRFRGDIRTLRLHASMIEKGDLKWVAASGIEGVAELAVHLPHGPGTYTVRMVFAEVGGAKTGERIFDVSINGKKVIAGLDIAAAAGGARRSLVKEIKVVSSQKSLVIKFTPKKGKPIICGLEHKKDKSAR
jgi:outer membrane protein assembly factor BamB